MAVYVARQPDGLYAVFDDLSVRFVATSLRLGEAVALLRRLAGCGARPAWRELSHALRDIPIGGRGCCVSPEADNARFDDLLNALCMIRGRAVMKMELLAIGIPLYEPRREASDAVLELCDCFLADEPGRLG
jgi:hypothetical protein